jgi:hypothetical protein
MFMQTATKKGLLLSLSSLMVLVVVLTQFDDTSVFQAEALTLTADFATGTWINKNSQANQFGDVANSPYRVTTNDIEYIVSTGFFESGTSSAIFGAKTALTVSNHYNLSKDSSLAEVNALTNETFEASIFMNEDLWNVEIDLMTVSWTEKSNDIYTFFYFIYSLDGGLSWQVDEDTKKTNFNDGALTATFDVNAIQGNRVRVGFLTTKSSNTLGLYLTNPTITLNYRTLSDSESVTVLTNEVLLYTPCVSDEDALILITDNKKIDLITKYNQLSNTAKTLFQNESIGDGYTAYERYSFLIQ